MRRRMSYKQHLEDEDEDVPKTTRCRFNKDTSYNDEDTHSGELNIVYVKHSN